MLHFVEEIVLLQLDDTHGRFVDLPLSAGNVVLAGAALMELALGLATAQPCFAGRWTPTRPVRTLYIDGELSPGQLRRRWRRFPILDGAPLQVLSRRWARSQGVNWPSLYAREGQAMLIELSHAIGPR